MAAPDGNGRVELDGDDWEVGFDAGVLFEPTERKRLGLLYFSGWDLEFGGDLEVLNNLNGNLLEILQYDPCRIIDFSLSNRRVSTQNS